MSAVRAALRRAIDLVVCVDDAIAIYRGRCRPRAHRAAGGRSRTRARLEARG